MYVSKKITYKCGCEYIQYLLKEYTHFMKMIVDHAACNNCGRCHESRK